MNNGMKRMGALMLALVLLVFASGCKGEPSPSSDGSMTDTSYSSDVSGEDMPTGGDNSNTPTDDTNNVDNPSGGDSTKPNTDVPSSSANQSRPSGLDLNLRPVVSGEGLHSGAPRHWDCLIQRIGSWPGFLAMWAEVATPEQAERMVKENLLDEKAFWAPFGVRTLSKYEKMYTIRASGNPSCWLGPVWGISNYMVFRGLVKYGFEREAAALAEKSVHLFETDIAVSGELHEYYDPESGRPIMNPGFQNWNLLSLNMQAWLRGENVIEEF